MHLVYEVSEITKINMLECYKLPLVDFLNYLSFSREYNRKKAKMIQDAYKKK